LAFAREVPDTEIHPQDKGYEIDYKKKNGAVGAHKGKYRKNATPQID